MAFDPRQMQIIRDGLQAGLDVEWYANTSFDYLQMEQIYLALEAGIKDEEALNMLCDPRIPFESMEKIRESLFEQFGIYEEASEKIKRKKIIRLFITFFLIAAVGGTCSILYINRETIGYYFEDIHLELKSERIDLGMSKPFIASDYIKKYDKNCKLKLPDEKKFKDIGTYTVTYQLSNKVKTVSKDLIIDVYDDVSPEITLTSSSVSLDLGNQFNGRDYIKSASDNIDGDLKSKVEYNDIDTNTSNTYVVTYKVSDSSGNQTSAIMNVLVKEKNEEQLITNSYTNKNSNNSNSNSSSSSTNKTSKNASSYNKFFDGYSIESYNAACDYAEGLRNSGKISGYSVTPTGDGVQVECW